MIEVTAEELESIRLESTRNIQVEGFVKGDKKRW